MPSTPLPTSFNSKLPRAQAAAKKHAAKLVTSIAQETEAALRVLVARSIRDGITTDQSARLMRGILRQDGTFRGGMAGLNARQYASVLNFREELINSGMSAARVDAAVAKLQEKKLRQRAKMISRTECLLGDAMVSAAVVRAVHRRRYAGYVAEIMTADGRKLTATPNHPMLTDRGWVGAGALEHGDYLVCDSRNKDFRAARDMNVAMPPASLREIFETAAAIGLVERKATGEPDFHGDGVDGYVDIARPLRGLHLGNFASIYEPLVDLLLSPSDSSCFPFCRECSRLLPINECACICRRSPGDSELVEPTMDETGSNAEIGSDTTGAFASLVADSNVAGVDIGAIGWVLPSTAEESSPSIAECSGGDSSLFQGVENPRPVASELAGDGSGAEASDIELDRVVSVFLRPFSGHVFNLSTPDGYFTFNDGVYTGNTIDSLNAGVLEGWKEAERQGFLDTDEMGKKWIVTPDDRLCPICAPIPDQGVIHIEEKFATSAGEKDAPTAHPHCRCAIAMGLLPLAEAARLADPNFKNFDPGDIGPDGFRPTQADLEAAQQFGGQVNSEIDRLTRTYARLGDFEIDDIIIYNERTLASLGKPTAIGNYRQNKISLAWDRFNNVADELTIGPFTHVNGSLMGTARHEMAHGVWFHHMSLKEKQAFDDMFTRLFGKRMNLAGGTRNTLVSQYAEYSTGEFFAESMSAFMHPKYRKGMLPKKVEDFLARILRTSGKRHLPSAAEVAVGWDDAYNAWAKGASKLKNPSDVDLLSAVRRARNAARTPGVVIAKNGDDAALLKKWGRSKKRGAFAAEPAIGSAEAKALSEVRDAVAKGKKFHSHTPEGQLLTKYGPKSKTPTQALSALKSSTDEAIDAAKAAGKSVVDDVPAKPIKIDPTEGFEGVISYNDELALAEARVEASLGIKSTGKKQKLLNRFGTEPPGGTSAKLFDEAIEIRKANSIPRIDPFEDVPFADMLDEWDAVGYLPEEGIPSNEKGVLKTAREKYDDWVRRQGQGPTFLNDFEAQLLSTHGPFVRSGPLSADLGGGASKVMAKAKREADRLARAIKSGAQIPETIKSLEELVDNELLRRHWNDIGDQMNNKLKGIKQEAIDDFSNSMFEWLRSSDSIGGVRLQQLSNLRRGRPINANVWGKIPKKAMRGQAAQAKAANAQYEVLQDILKQIYPDGEITLYRGVTSGQGRALSKAGAAVGDTVEYSNGALGSWTTNRSTAKSFATNPGSPGYVIEAKVPIGDIFTVPGMDNVMEGLGRPPSAFIGELEMLVEGPDRVVRIVDVSRRHVSSSTWLFD